MAIIKPNNNTISAITALPAGVGGKVLQVVYASDGTEVSTTSTSYQSTSLTANITPSSTSNKILIYSSIVFEAATTANNADIFGVRLDADGSSIFNPDGSKRFGIRIDSSGDNNAQLITTFNYLHSPSSTSEIAYSIKVASRDGSTIKMNSNTGESSLTLMEIAG
jgi:hypothetical protein